MVLTEPALRRSRTYSTLSRGFLYPVRGLLLALQGDGLVGALRATLPSEGISVAERVQAALDGPGDREAEYNALFGGQAVPCPLYETEYTGKHVWMQTQQMADIAGFYRAFGVDVPGERPDGLSTQLEFMGLLCMKEAVARAEGLIEQEVICREAQHKFLTEHLARWLPEVLKRMERMGVEGYYPELLRLTHWFVQEEVSQCRL